MDLIIQADAFKRTGNASFADIAGDVTADFDDALMQRGFQYYSSGEKARGPFPRRNKNEIDGPSGPRQNQACFVVISIGEGGKLYGFRNMSI